MRDIAGKTLAELGFPKCTLFELYWLCCVFSDYAEYSYYADLPQRSGFKFEKLVLPNWFPFPFVLQTEATKRETKKGTGESEGPVSSSIPTR
jgi:hypothetical protein